MLNKLKKVIKNPGLAKGILARKAKKIVLPKKYVGDINNRSESDTGHYVSFVEKACNNYKLFANFKRNSIYNDILEHVSYETGLKYLKIILNQSPDFISTNLMNSFKINDSIGNPRMYSYDGVGRISPSTLRYIKIASDIKNYFGDLNGKKIAEIGVGYGGQFLILDQLYKMRYTLFDLDPVLNLTSKYLECHILNSTYKTTTLNRRSDDFDCDLIISNYAFSELPSQLQLAYLENIISKAKMGYMIMNSGMSDSVFKINKLNIEAITKHIQGLEILEEQPYIMPGTYLLVWGRNISK